MPATTVENARRATKEVVRQTKLLIGGEFCSSVSGKTFPTINPATEEKIADISEGDAEDIDRAVRAAHKAFYDSPWTKLSGRERGTLMYRWADLMEKNLEELAKLETLDNGKGISDSLGDAAGAVEVVRYYAGWADKVHGQVIPIPGPYLCYTKKEPVGVCGQIIPWNYPMDMASWKLAPALAMGCTVVLKPAEQTSLSALRMGELALEAGFPAGVINIVPGFGPTAGAALVRHPLVNKIAFTGEVKTGQLIQREATETLKRITLELGGKSPNIVLADADLDMAVTGAFKGVFSNMGQNCCAGSRIFLHESIHDEFVDRLKQKAQARRVGDPLDKQTEHGALVDKAQYEKVMHYIGKGKEQGANCVVGGERAFTTGYFVKPTVFTGVDDKMAIATDEIFGPVASILKFSKIEEVAQRANSTPFGLAAAVWTKDLQSAHYIADTLKAGTVWVNCYNNVDTAAPFGGYKMSGIGRELGEKGLDTYTEIKTVTIRKG